MFEPVAVRRFFAGELSAFKAEWPGWRPAAWRSLPSLLLWLSLLLLRSQVAADVGLPFADSIQAGVVLGAVQDLLVVLGAVWVAVFVQGASALPARFLWALFAGCIWLASFANLVYYRYFGMRLDWWVVRQHWRDITVVGGSAKQLGVDGLIVLSALFCLAAMVVALFWRRVRASGPARTQSLRRALWLALPLLLLWRLPGWLGAQPSNIVSDNIVRAWVSQLWGDKLLAGTAANWAAAATRPRDAQAPGRVLAAFRDRGVTPAPEPRPLYAPLAVEPQHRERLRARLGLPAQGPVHVVILFLESTRALEVQHAELGPHVMPHLRDIVARHGIDFRQAYSSAFAAGQTVRGQFSTLCSMIPNNMGAAEYIAHPTLRVRCLQEVLRDHGYRTVWMNGYRDSFHGKRTFEMLHGTELFFDGDAYRRRGITETVGEWGVADLPFLRESVHILEELAREGKPLFAHILTTSVHHPYGPVAAAPLAAELAAMLGDADYYRGYLGRLHYEDLAVRAFFDLLFAGPLGERTLVVLMADHGAGVRPHLALSPVQKEEMRYRIPLALVTRDLPEASVVTHPVHQVDVAPTVAAVVGAGGLVTWVGRNLLGEQGSTWVTMTGQGMSYRTPARGCYSLPKTPELKCWDTTTKDPLFDELTPTSDDPEETAFLRQVVEANAQAILFNLVQPP